MQSNFKAKHIKNAKESLSQDLNIAQQHLDNYKEKQNRRLEELLKKPTLWQKISNFFSNYF